MNDLNLKDRLKRIEQLLVANKEVLTLDEACQYTGISQGYMYKLTCAGKIPHSKPRGKFIYFERSKLNSWLLGNPNLSAMNDYEFSRVWFHFSFNNPNKVKPIHTAIYFFAIERCNGLGWKEEFGFPTDLSMEALGIKNYKTFIKALQDLVDWGFIKWIQKSRNQYTDNIIALVKNITPPPKALHKALRV